jgi:predicted ATPase/class 3 adenylate cyclase
MAELRTGTVTLLSSDIEGSTRLLRRLGDAYAETLGEHRRRLREAFARWDGHEVDTQGDAFLFAFPRARDGVAAAVDAQHALAADAWPNGERVRVRIGVHTGEPARTETGYVGLDVHRAARICAAGHGEQILISATTAQLLDGEPLPGGSLRDLGEYLLKDLGVPERLYQIVAPGLPHEFPAPQALNVSNLPIPPTRLIGRADEVAQATALLLREDVRLLTCTGPGGTGKTRLALHVGADLAGSFGDGVVFVALAPIRDARLVAPAIAAALGLRDSGDLEPETALVEHVRTKELLVVLDNFEHVSSSARVVAQLLAHAPRLKILVTSRAPLHLRGERELPVPTLEQSEAVTLFVERAIAVGGIAGLTAENTRAVGEICVRLDGLPLALELAAARTKVASPEELLARLSRRLDVLSGEQTDLPARQQTLRRTIDWSYDLLSPAEQALFAQFAVFAAGATLPTIEAVCDCDDPLGVVGALVDNSLIQRSDRPTEPTRFTMLETVREYALERLVDRDDADSIADCHAAHYVEVAESAEPELVGERQVECLQRLESEHDNLRAAVTRLLETDVSGALRLLAALTRFWRAHGHVTEARESLERALADARDVDPEVLARALWTMGRLAIAQGDYTRAANAYEGSLPLFRALARHQDVIFALAELALIALEHGDVARASAHADEGVALARTTGDPRAISAALSSRASVSTADGDYTQARELYKESLELRRGLGDRLLIANSALNAGEAALAENDLDRAVQPLEECLAIARDLGEVIHTAAALCYLGEIALLRDDPGRAREMLIESLSLYAELENRRDAAECLHALAGLAAVTHEPLIAARLWGAVGAWRDRTGAVPFPAELAISERMAPVASRELGEAAFAAALAEGARVELESAIRAELERLRRHDQAIVE